MGHEWEELRDLRLRALTQAPEAFCSTLAESLRLTPAIWQERARMGAESERTATYVALESNRFRGMVVVTLEPALAEITGVYLDPEARGRGLATRMLILALEFAGGLPVHLEVNHSLTEAEALYARCGFLQDGPVRKFADGRVMRGWTRPATRLAGKSPTP